jgi:hypothetical protein
MAEATVPVVRKTAADLAAMARKSASRGSYRYVHVTAVDDRQSFPPVRVPHQDNPMKHFRAWNRLKWLAQDVRMFGAREVFRKWYYLGPVWHKKGEKVFVGRDENGNTYWTGFDSFGRGLMNRWIEPVDPHWFRGGDFTASTGGWYMWMAGHIPHTPAQVKARGESGPHGRQGSQVHPYNIHYYTGMMQSHGIDPTSVPQHGMLISPWQNHIKEAGYTRWVTNCGMPIHMPLTQPHDVKPEIVEDFYRGQAAYQRWSRGHDHDEWKN